MKINATKTLFGGILSVILALSCCWLPVLVIAVGGASSLMAFSAGVEKFSGVFMTIGAFFLAGGGYQLYQKNKQSMENTVLLE